MRPRPGWSGSRGWEASAGVADLGEQPGRADGAGAGQGREDSPVGVGGELVADAGGQGLDLGVEGPQDGHQGERGSRVDAGVLAGRAAGCGDQPGMQDRGVGSAAAGDRGQPGGQPPGRQPVRLLLGGEAAQERQGDRRVDAGEERRGGGNAFCRWARSWLAAATR